MANLPVVTRDTTRAMAVAAMILSAITLALDHARPDDAGTSLFLYGGDAEYRLKQEIILGLGGSRMLDELGFEIRKYHMNEGHSSLLILELLKRYKRDIE